MRPLLYLFFSQLKNRIISLKKKPGLLILYIFLLIFLCISMAYTILYKSQQVRQADARFVYLILAGFGILFLITFTHTGLSTGSTLFTLSDVGFLFVAPISPKKILNYGLINSLGRILMSVFFLIYQMSNLKTQFGYGIKEIFALFFIFIVLMFFCQLLSIALYMYTNQREKRKRIVKVVLYLSLAALILSVLIYQWQEQTDILQAVLGIVGSKGFGFFPVAGWTVMFLAAVVEGNVLFVFLSMLCFLVFGILIISLLMSGKADYYEDVLLSTEMTFNAVKAAKEGRVQLRVKKKVKVKDKDDNVWKGNGAFVFLIKQRLEMRRESRFMYVDGFTVFLMIAVAIASFNLRGKGNTPAYTILAGLIYYQYTVTALGRLKQELQKHYIYMIPVKASIKVFYASINSIYKHAVDAVLLFSIMAISRIASPLTCLFFALAYITSGALFVGLTIVYQRLLHGQPGMAAKMMVGMLLMILILMPGVILAVIMVIIIPQNLEFLSTLPFTIYCALLTLIIFALSGNVLDGAEFDGR